MSLFQDFVSGRLAVTRRMDFLVKYAEPVDCVELLMRCIAHRSEDILRGSMAEVPKNIDEAVERIKLSGDYNDVNQFLFQMLTMEDGALPALERLRILEEPESEEG
jgi:hypothetical protein